MNRLRVAFAPYWQSIQHALFPQLERVLGPLTESILRTISGGGVDLTRAGYVTVAQLASHASEQRREAAPLARSAG